MRETIGKEVGEVPYACFDASVLGLYLRYQPGGGSDHASNFQFVKIGALRPALPFIGHPASLCGFPLSFGGDSRSFGGFACLCFFCDPRLFCLLDSECSGFLLPLGFGPRIQRRTDEYRYRDWQNYKPVLN
ncbi:hypothetical protein BST27_17315 [Mycobacterium intermedium]|uniref:Uncharacterized protein n=1 Tax=Mycobacterium intermedium TaxID=28445 RepID=A0A1E3SE50_MYCIE|nr:hypothetical protein BHQ20_13445 [Mycobacterium intermedium]OPE51058.1 hypothetical protein BV508_07810 [Mycobacterium intermedium]ORB01768.1 hypothetical protein BST27_17315 [Mycobacterium intermedium]